MIGATSRGAAAPPDALAARVAQRERPAVGHGGAQHAQQLGLIARRGQRDVREAAQVGDVEHAMVRGLRRHRLAGAVHCEDDVELLQADVVNDLVETTLQERGVDRGDRLEALQRET